MNIKPYQQITNTNSAKAPLILVVEDEEDNLLFISHALVYLQYTFITATSGQEALNLATKHNISLILLDLRLPDINGFDLLKLLKQHNNTRNIPIIAISALIKDEDRHKAKSLGCNDYLTKPYLITELEVKLRQFLPNSFLNCHFVNYHADSVNEIGVWI